MGIQEAQTETEAPPQTSYVLRRGSAQARFTGSLFIIVAYCVLLPTVFNSLLVNLPWNWWLLWRIFLMITIPNLLYLAGPIAWLVASWQRQPQLRALTLLSGILCSCFVGLLDAWTLSAGNYTLLGGLNFLYVAFDAWLLYRLVTDTLSRQP